MKIKFLKSQPLVNLPPNVELIVFLIKEELKNVKFTNDLSRAGVDTCIGFLDFRKKANIYQNLFNVIFTPITRKR